jgi:hypothetical protein
MTSITLKTRWQSCFGARRWFIGAEVVMVNVHLRRMYSVDDWEGERAIGM